MAIIAKEPDVNYTPAPEGLHQAVCCDVIDLAIVNTRWGEKHQIEIRWQLDKLNEDSGKPFVVRRQYTCSLHEKAMLRQHLEAWRGRKFTKEELQGFDLEKLLEANCQLQVVQNVTDNGRTFANVQAVVPLGKGMTKIRPTDDYVREKDRAQNGEKEFEATEDDVPF